MIDDIEREAQQRMIKSIESLKSNLAKIRSGRAHAGILDQVTLEYYGNEVPLNQAATISVDDARTLLVSPWDKAMIPVIEKAILSSNLGLNPVTSGMTVRVPLPPLTEQRRKEMIKLARGESEQARVAIRNIRRDANGNLKELLKNKDISEDEEHRAQEIIQKITDKNIRDIDMLLATKEKELLVV